MIRPLDATSARLLSSGQVIVSVASVMKELLENALDAEATVVDIYAVAYGLDLLVVSDNGTGIPLSAACPPTASGTAGNDDEAGDSSCFLLAARASSKCPALFANGTNPSSHNSFLAASQPSLPDALASSNGASLSVSAAAAAAGGALDTLGFRGEALHSLAHTSTVTLHTRCTVEQGEPAGTARAVTYASDRNATSVARLRLSDAACPAWLRSSSLASGTTVTVSELFAMLPVRRKDAVKNGKRAFLGAIALIKQYALTNPHVRLMVRHQEEARAHQQGEQSSGSAPPTTLVATSGSGDLLRSLGDCYGSRVLGDMEPVEWTLSRCRVRGYVSKVGRGRAINDLHCFALHGRLVDLPRLAKAVQEAFVQCHPSAMAGHRLCPAFFLALEQLEGGSSPTSGGLSSASAEGIAASNALYYDVNITPDKRQVLLQSEEALVKELYAAARRVFTASAEAVVNLSGSGVSGNTPTQQQQQRHVSGGGGLCSPSQAMASARPLFTPVVVRQALPSVYPNPHPAGLDEPRKFYPRLSADGGSSHFEHTPASGGARHGAVGDAPVMSASAASSTRTHVDPPAAALAGNGRGDCSCCGVSPPRQATALPNDVAGASPARYIGNTSCTTPTMDQRVGGTPGDIQQQKQQLNEEDREEEAREEEALPLDDASVGGAFRPVKAFAAWRLPLLAMSGMPPLAPLFLRRLRGVTHDGDKEGSGDEDGDADAARGANPPSRKKPRTEGEERGQQAGGKRGSAKAKPPRTKPLAQQHDGDLDGWLSKAAFATMTVYGQFNHGFIVASTGAMLFVIDQHAADEKYNYEQLVAGYVAKPQPLVQPMLVAMDLHEAELVLEHQKALALHGFLVSSAAAAAPTLAASGGLPCSAPAPDAVAAAATTSGGIRVHAVPVLPYDTVTPRDLLELSQQLVQYGALVKPLKAVWHSLATKACRTSIMIGTALDRRTLVGIVRHMATMHAPWNCPHGRPTLRHVGYLPQQ